MTAQLVSHRVVDKIHIFKFESNSPDAMQQYFEILVPIYDAQCQHNPTVPLCLLLDISKSGMFSLTLMIRQMTQALSERRTRLKLYIAYMTDNYHNRDIVALLQLINENRLKHTRKVFPQHEFDSAIKWLASMRAAPDEVQRQTYSLSCETADMMAEQLVSHRVIDGIDVYEFVDNSTHAINQYMDIFTDIYETACADEPQAPLCFVMDITKSGMFLITHVIHSTNKAFRERDVALRQYIAYITDRYDDRERIRVISEVDSHYNFHTRRVFASEQFEEAITWLKGIQADYEADNT